MSVTAFRNGYAWTAWHSYLGSFGDWPTKGKALRATEHSGHEIDVQKFKAGMHPIAGWNWPMWGFRVVCSCGYRSQNVAGYTKETVREHLERQ